MRRDVFFKFQFEGKTVKENEVLITHSYLESWGYPTLKAIPAIYGGSALYMVVMQPVGWFPRKSVIDLFCYLLYVMSATWCWPLGSLGPLYSQMVSFSVVAQKVCFVRSKRWGFLPFSSDPESQCLHSKKKKKNVGSMCILHIGPTFKQNIYYMLCVKYHQCNKQILDWALFSTCINVCTKYLFPSRCKNYFISNFWKQFSTNWTKLWYGSFIAQAASTFIYLLKLMSFEKTLNKKHF